MQMQCKAAMLLLLLSCCCCKSSGIDYALLYPEKRKERYTTQCADTWQQNAKYQQQKKKNILLSKVARHHCKSAATCHMLASRNSPLQLELWQFYWMQHKVFRSKRESEHSLSFAALIIIYLKCSFVALALRYCMPRLFMNSQPVARYFKSYLLGILLQI